MHWNTELAYFVTPKSGPMRPMRTLIDANRALLDDLPFGCRRQPHWGAVGRLLLIAADTASTIDVRLATDALVRALETEGWMSRARPAAPPAGAAGGPRRIAGADRIDTGRNGAGRVDGTGRMAAAPCEAAAWCDHGGRAENDFEVRAGFHDGAGVPIWAERDAGSADRDDVRVFGAPRRDQQRGLASDRAGRFDGADTTDRRPPAPGAARFGADEDRSTLIIRKLP